MSAKPKKRSTRVAGIRLEPLENRMLYSADGAALHLLLAADINETLPAIEENPEDLVDLINPLESEQTVKTVVVIDSSVPDAEALANEFESDAATEVVFLSVTEDGVDTLTTYLSALEGVQQIKIFTHSDGSSLKLGSADINSTTIDLYQKHFLSWQTNLDADADIMIYGCSLAATDSGLNLIHKLAAYTESDIAASNDLSGHAARQGDWDLEYKTGKIDSEHFLDDDFAGDWNHVLANITVTTTDDVVDGDTSSLTQLIANPGTDGFISLREAVLAANNTGGEDQIFLPAGNFLLQIPTSGTPNDATTGDLDITDGLIITGDGISSTTIDGGDSMRILSISNANVNVQELTLSDGTATSGDGGAVRITGGQSTFNTVSIEGSVAALQGGAIKVSNGALNVIDSEFDSNNAFGHAGAIYVDSSASLRVTGTLFENNSSSDDGGAIFNTGNLTVEDSAFKLNQASDDGSAISSISSASITSSTFSDNTTIFGAGTVINRGNLDLSTSYFYGNYAGSSGGAVHNNATANITDSTFEDNGSGTYGGAIGGSTGGNTTVKNSTFLTNESTTEGGAIALFGPTTLSVTFSTFRQNVALTTSGAIYVDSGNGTVQNSIFDNNTSASAAFSQIDKAYSKGFNLFTDTPGVTLAIGDIVGGTANLGPLQDNGGPVMTMMPLAYSDAIDSGVGGSRIDAHANASNEYADMGAVEFISQGDTRKVYWTDENGQAIYRANEDGATSPTLWAVQRITTTSLTPHDIEYHHGLKRLFWVENDGDYGQIMSSDLDGQNKIVSADNTTDPGMLEPNGIAIDETNNHVYLTSDYHGQADPTGVDKNTIRRYTITGNTLTLDTVVYTANVAYSSPMGLPTDIEYFTNPVTGEEWIGWVDEGITFSTTLGGPYAPRIAVLNLDTASAPPTYYTLPADAEPTGIALNTATGNAYISDNVYNLTAVAFDPANATHTVVEGPQYSGTSNNISAVHYDADKDMVWYTTSPAGVASGSINTADSALQNHAVAQAQVNTPTSLSLTPISAVAQNFTLTNTGLALQEGANKAINTVDLKVTDPDTGSASVVYTVTSPPANGMLELVSNPGIPITTFTQTDIDLGLIRYQHDNSSTGADSFEFLVTDGDYTTTGQKFNIAISDSNQAPVAGNGTISLNEGSTINSLTDGTSTFSNLAGLVQDPDSGDSLSFAVAQTASNGTVAISQAGNFTYTHNGSEVLSDSFDYRVTDAAGAQDVGRITITVSPVNDNAPQTTNDVAVVPEGGSVTVLQSGFGSVLFNDSDIDFPHDILSAVLLTGPGFNAQAGTVTLNPDGSFSYQHDGSENFTDRFYYEARDNSLAATQGWVDITILPVNDNTPFVPDDSIVLAEGSSTGIFSSGRTSLTDGFTDADVGDTAANAIISVISAPLAGTLTPNADLTFDYTHDGSEIFTDSFVYRVEDSTGNFDDVNIAIVINPVNDNTPFIADGQIVVNEGASSSVLVSGNNKLTDGFSDTDLADTAANASISLITSPAFGNLVINPDYTFLYTHDGSENYIDGFVYRVSDTAGNSHDVSVGITVNPANDNSPLVPDDTLAVAEGGMAMVFNSGRTNLLDNFSDADPQDTAANANITLNQAPVFGNLVINPDNTFTYTHDGSENLNDAFVYVVSDTAGNSDSVKVAVTASPVNDAPTTANSSVNAIEDTTYTFETADFPFQDLSENHLFSGIVLETLPVKGNLALSSTALSVGDFISATDLQLGNFKFSPAANENGTSLDQFAFRVVDDGGTLAGGNDTSVQPASITINVAPVNDDPTTTGTIQNQTYAENSAQTLAAPPSLFSDIDGDPLQLMVTMTDGSPLVPWMSFDAATSVLSINPTATEIGAHSLTISADDSQGGIPATTTFVINVTDVNDPPTAINPSLATVFENSPGLMITPLQAVDVDTGDTFSFQVDDPRFEVINAELWLKPGIALDYETEPSISLALTVTDSAGAMTTQSLILEVLDLNDAPVAQSNNTSIESIIGETINLDTLIFTDQDDTNLTLTAALPDGSPLPAWLSFNPTTQALQFSGDQQDWPETTTLEIVVVATDSTGDSDSTLVELILESAEPPTPAAALPGLPIDMPESEPVTTTTPTTEETPEEPDTTADATPDADATPHSEPVINALENAALEVGSGAVQQINESINTAAEPYTIVPGSFSIKHDRTEIRETDSQLALLLPKPLEISLAKLIKPNLIDLAYDPEFTKRLDTQQQQLAKQRVTVERIETVSFGVTTGVSVGYILWMIRSGAVFASMMSALPAWRAIDPLPVLSSFDNDDDSDDESLTSMVENNTDDSDETDSDKTRAEAEAQVRTNQRAA